MALQKKDFVEIEFTAKVKDSGEVFDSNIKEDLEKLHSGHDHKIESKPFVFSLGEGMFLKGVEDFLVGKEEKGNYEIELSSENAFGKRDQNMIQKMPIKLFAQQNLRPIPGHMFNFDGRVGKVLSVSGGRVVVDFNNPLSGKDVVYNVKVLRKVEDLNEKIKSFIDFVFRREIPFKVEGKKLILSVEKPMVQFAQMFAEKFKDIFDLDLEVKERSEEKKPESKEKKEKNSAEEKVEEKKS